MNKYYKFIDNQFGFQKGKSTVDFIFILHALISKTLANKKKLYVAFIDWEKMFDKIDRLFLWQKLINENIKYSLNLGRIRKYGVLKFNVSLLLHQK